MMNRWALCAVSVGLGLSLATAPGTAAPAASPENGRATAASIGEAIAARIIAVKCRGSLTPREIAEFDTFIDEHQTTFMLESVANRRLAESVFPRIARDYDFSFSRPESCTEDARTRVQNALARVRGETSREKQAGLAR